MDCILSAWERVEYINIYLLFVSAMGSDVGGVGLLTLGNCCVLCQAGAELRRARPVGPAGEVSCAGG